MKIEIITFYPHERDDQKDVLTGTLHIRFPLLEIDIRGIRVLKKKKKLIFFMPYQKAYDIKTKNIVRYPVFSFSDISINKEFTRQIFTKCEEYINNNVLNKYSDPIIPISVQDITQKKTMTQKKLKPENKDKSCINNNTIIRHKARTRSLFSK